MAGKSQILAIVAGKAAERLGRVLGSEILAADAPDLTDAVKEAAKRAPTAVLVCIVPDHIVQTADFATVQDEGFRAGVEEPLFLLIRVFQALGEAWASGPPPVFCAGPAVGLFGAGGLVMLTGLMEGQRAVMKSAARQWGERGFHFTWLALSTLDFAPELEGTKLVVSQDPDGLALGHAPATSGLADFISLLSDPRARMVTGSTVIADGGELMLP